MYLSSPNRKNEYSVVILLASLDKITVMTFIVRL